MMDQRDQDLVRAYRLFFNSPEGLAVAKDLMAFCKFRSPVENGEEEGMRRVFLRILSMSQLSDEQLIHLYAGRMMIQPTEPQDE